MPLNWPDISQNQLFQASLGLLGAGMDRGANPFLAAQQGLAYGSQLDKNAKEQARLDAEEARRKRLEDAWGGLFGGGSAPDVAGGGGSGIAGGDAMPMPDPSQSYGGVNFGLGVPEEYGGMRDPLSTQIASTSPGMAGMGPAAAPGGNPMLAGMSPQEMSFLQAMGPEQGARMLWDRMNRSPNKGVEINGRLVDPTSGRVIADFSGDEKLTDDQREYAAAQKGGFEGSFMDYMMGLRQAGASRQTVQLPTQENEEAKAVGKWYGEQFTNLQQGAMDARTQNARLDRMGQLLEGVATGKTAPTTQAIKATAKSAGIDLEALGITDDVGPAEAAQALSSQMALQLRNPAGGAGMPGAMSDKDREFLQSMVPGLATSPEGRKLMIETQRRLNDRSIEVARLSRDYRKKNGKLDEGFFDELDAYSRENPLFEDLAPPQQAQVPPPAERTIGGFYQTPKGRAMWTGEGWQLESDTPGGSQ